MESTLRKQKRLIQWLKKAKERRSQWGLGGICTSSLSNWVNSGTIHSYAEWRKMGGIIGRNLKCAHTVEGTTWSLRSISCPWSLQKPWDCHHLQNEPGIISFFASIILSCLSVHLPLYVPYCSFCSAFSSCACFPADHVYPYYKASIISTFCCLKTEHKHSQGTKETPLALCWLELRRAKDSKERKPFCSFCIYLKLS